MCTSPKAFRMTTSVAAVPKLAQRAFVLGSGELLDRGLVAMVKGLLNKLAAALRLASEGDALLVQVMVIGALCAVDAEFDQQPTYFGVRKTGTNNRAMDAVMHVPDRRAPLGGRPREFF